MSKQLVSNVATDEARRAHAKMVLEQLLEKFDTIEMLSYVFSDIGTDHYVRFKFKVDDTYIVELSVRL